MKNNKIQDNTILSVTVHVSETIETIRYTMLDGICFWEENCFSTKEELIKSL